MSSNGSEAAPAPFPQGLRSFLVRAVAGAGLVHFAGMLLTFVVGVQLARGLGVHAYGQYGIAMAAISMAGIPGEFGLPRLVMRETAAALARDDLPRLLGIIRWADRSALMLSLAAACLLAFGALLFVGEGASTVARAILVGTPVIPIVALMKIRGGALRGLTHVVLGQVPAELLRPLLFSVLLLGLFVMVPDAGAADAMVLNVVTALLGLAAAFALLRPRLPRPRPLAIVRNGRKLVASALPMALTDGLRVFQAQLIVLALGLLMEAADVGLFRIAVATAFMTAVPSTLVGNVTAPLLARLHAQGDRSRLQLLSVRSAQVTTAGVIALSIPIFLFGAELIDVLFGEEFRPAFPALAVLCGGQILHSCFGPNGSLLVMSGHERRVTRASLLSLFVCVAALLALVPPFGLVGAALASGLALLVWNVVCWSDARRRVQVDTSIIAGLARS